MENTECKLVRPQRPMLGQNGAAVSSPTDKFMSPITKRLEEQRTRLLKSTYKPTRLQFNQD